MSSSDDLRVDSLKWHRKGSGLTQTDLARLVGVSQQAIAKWEQANAVPKDRLASVAKHLRIPREALLAIEGASESETKERVSASVGEFFARQVVVDYGARSFHYQPTVEESLAFWTDVQDGGFVHLSAGPVQVLINLATALRVDISEDPPLSSYKPYPISPFDVANDDETAGKNDVGDVENEEGAAARTDSSDAEDGDADQDDGAQRWFEEGHARIFLRGVGEPYSAPQAFFSDYLDRDDLSEAEYAAIHEKFQCTRDDEHSIFDLFEHTASQSDAGPFLYEPGEELHADALRVFESEDYDGVPQHTWVHNRDIQVIEVPTRLWTLHRLSVNAWLKKSAEELKAKRQGTGSKRKTRRSK